MSDDEGYENRCDESRSQDLDVNVVSHTYSRTTQGATYQGDDSTTKHPSLLTTNGKGTETKVERVDDACKDGQVLELKPSAIIANRRNGRNKQT